MEVQDQTPCPRLTQNPVSTTTFQCFAARTSCETGSYNAVLSLSNSAHPQF
jgi:hypothetical protein